MALALVLLLGASIAGAQAASDETILISRQSAADGGAVADDDSLDPSVSADGRYVAFSSQANTLIAADDNAVQNVFVRDTRTTIAS